MRRTMVFAIRFLGLGLLVVLTGALLNQTARLGDRESDGPYEEIHGNYVTDFSNDARLVGWSDEVFIGKVLGQAGSTERWPRYIETQFNVLVIE
jgi:hypothetical protein